MHKLKLDLDQLAVDTFDTEAPPVRKGTVYGEQCTCYTACTCPGCPTCDVSCNGTCAGTCDASCNGTCGGSCDGTCDATCNGTCYDCTAYDYTCRNIGTCNYWRGDCAHIP